MLEANLGMDFFNVSDKGDAMLLANVGFMLSVRGGS